jgi:hypothetical protein
MDVCDNDGIHQQVGPGIALEGHGAQYQLDGRVRGRRLDPTNEVNDESAREIQYYHAVANAGIPQIAMQLA